MRKGHLDKVHNPCLEILLMALVWDNPCIRKVGKEHVEILDDRTSRQIAGKACIHDIAEHSNC